MEPDDYSFSKAKITDLQRIIEIIHDGQLSLGKLGVDQWQNGYPPLSTIESDILHENAYLLCDSKEAICTSTVIFSGEPTYENIYDGKWLTDGCSYAVIHRMSVSEKNKNRGVASFMLQKIVNMSLEKKMKSIRIDTHRDNIPMQNMIKKNGFTYCGVIYLLDGNERIAFERIL